jgi:uncharacterized membrane protein YvbJ
LKNALERGENLSKAKQSFLNAGYTSQEINAAVQKIPNTNRQPLRPLNQQSVPQPLSNPKTPQQTSQKISKKTLIIIAVVGIIVILIALILGLFWNKLF